MEEYYLVQIWQVIGLKENKSLTVEEKQKKILQILRTMKIEADKFAKESLKKQFIKVIDDSINTI